MVLSDNFGHSNCVILRDSYKVSFSPSGVNALIRADFCRNRANSRNFKSGFDSRCPLIVLLIRIRPFSVKARGPVREFFRSLFPPTPTPNSVCRLATVDGTDNPMILLT